MNISQAIVHPTTFISNLLINCVTSNCQVLQDYSSLPLLPATSTTCLQWKIILLLLFPSKHHSHLWPLNTWYMSCLSYSQDSTTASLPPHSRAARHKDLLLWLRHKRIFLTIPWNTLPVILYTAQLFLHQGSKETMPSDGHFHSPSSPLHHAHATGKHLVYLPTAGREGAMLAPDLEQLLSTFSVLNEWTWHHAQSLQLSK